ncbi:uncharacterized protein LOC121590612 [Anopheles merus]|uniref:uncharacterized protein LOC121590612 n=1 Tax=Anopheles merus TaxID=30066 RepID=UPI001BE3F4ED|nr:uncharacterized protein LOC121590612 [Anopheles merus]
MRVTDVPQAPVFVVALFCGKTKPASAEDYLRQLVTELNQLQSTGIVLSGIQVKIRVRAIIADTPARAFIKGVISHNGYDSCLKCTEHTVYDQITHRMHFSGVDAPKRIAKEFKEGKYKRHRINTTPLTVLDYFDIIDDVPTTDRLHLIDLGVMRYLMRSWKKAHEQHYELAHEMLLKFVRDYATLYGESFISSNVHNLKHVYDDVAVPEGRCETPTSEPFGAVWSRPEPLDGSRSRSEPTAPTAQTAPTTPSVLTAPTGFNCRLTAPDGSDGSNGFGRL